VAAHAAAAAKNGSAWPFTIRKLSIIEDVVEPCGFGDLVQICRTRSGDFKVMGQDVRLQHLHRWLAVQLPPLFVRLGWGTVPDIELLPASSDASFRRYFRWRSGQRSLIVMDAPPPQENCEPFVRIAGLLADAGLNVPEIYAADLDHGFLVLSDLGTQTYLDVINETNADPLYEQAIDALVALQVRGDAGGLPAYDDALLRRELQLFPEWYLAKHLHVELDPGQGALWKQTCDLLIDSALAQPTVLVHRDYMPRNLMISSPKPGVLDFQDAVKGPVTYDATCLFKDAFLSWPDEKVIEWLRLYWQRARANGVPVAGSFDAFLFASDLMGVQRHLKVIGIFARICHRDGKPRYLADVPRFFGYIHTVLDRRPELSPLRDLLQSLPRHQETPA
jgi:aminoglycoside/choline kinase family phosphotransferase